jgi:hypothetical protein
VDRVWASWGLPRTGSKWTWVTWGPGQAKYLETARVAPGVGQGHSGAGPSPCGSYGGTFTGVRTVVSWGAWSPAESDVVGPVRVGRGEGRPR